jgi:hypothetical protein
MEGIRDRVNRLELTDEKILEKHGEKWFADSMLSEFEWVAFLVSQRMLQFKVVERSFGQQMVSWVVVLKTHFDARPDHWPNLRSLLEQFKRAGSVSFEAMENEKETANAEKA